MTTKKLYWMNKLTMRRRRHQPNITVEIYSENVLKIKVKSIRDTEKKSLNIYQDCNKRRRGRGGWWGVVELRAGIFGFMSFNNDVLLCRIFIARCFMEIFHYFIFFLVKSTLTRKYSSRNWFSCNVFKRIIKKRKKR